MTLVAVKMWATLYKVCSAVIGLHLLNNIIVCISPVVLMYLNKFAGLYRLTTYAEPSSTALAQFLFNFCFNVY